MERPNLRTFITIYPPAVKLMPLVWVVSHQGAQKHELFSESDLGFK